MRKTCACLLRKDMYPFKTDPTSKVDGFPWIQIYPWVGSRARKKKGNYKRRKKRKLRYIALQIHIFPTLNWGSQTTPPGFFIQQNTYKQNTFRRRKVKLPFNLSNPSNEIMAINTENMIYWATFLIWQNIWTHSFTYLN